MKQVDREDLYKSPLDPESYQGKMTKDIWMYVWHNTRTIACVRMEPMLDALHGLELELE